MQNFDKLAQQYVDSIGQVLPGYHYSFNNRRDFHRYIYFDFSLINMDGTIPNSPPSIGGAVGFIIHKQTLEIRSLNISELSLMIAKQKELELAFEKLRTTTDKAKSILWLKSNYKLTSSELSPMLRILNREPIEKDLILEKLDTLIP